MNSTGGHDRDHATHAATEVTVAPERHDSKVVDDEDVPGRAAKADAAQHDRNASEQNGHLRLLNTLMIDVQNASRHHSPASAGLHIETTTTPSSTAFTTIAEPPTIFETPVETTRPAITSPTSLTAMGSSLRSNLSTNSIAPSLSPGTTASALTSPYLAAMADITPLPSPIIGSESGNWRRPRVGSNLSSRPINIDTNRTSRASSVSSRRSPPKRKTYGSLVPTAVGAATATHSESAGNHGHGRSRSISDFIPGQLQNFRQRNATLGQAGVEYQMHRETNIATQRGLNGSDASRALPSPPPSNTSAAEDDEPDDDQPTFLVDGEQTEFLYIRCGIHQKRCKFSQLRQLGQGTFSKVMLATSERIPSNPPPEIERHLDPHRLVAVKIVEHGPAGGADEERIEISLRREVEMLKSVSHPSLIRLKTFEDQLTRTLLVLTYCPGGDLFELASDKRDVLRPAMVQRIFAELVSAVRYLHTHWIVHRDIKLENVLVNLSHEQMREVDDPATFPTPLVTLSDLGLSRRIPEPPESPLLTTRCGSEDYAAPEILLGQPYDGRLTDAWALGVLLYALMEGRLPFDATPGKPDRSRNTHRIARCDWIWCRFGDDSGDWNSQRGTQFEGGRLCVEALLKKVRMGRKPLDEVEKYDWVQDGMKTANGLQMRVEDLNDL